MKRTASLLFVILLVGCQRNVDLSAIVPRISKVTVYDREGLNGLSVTGAELTNSSQAELDADLIRSLLPKARFKNDWVLWKGSRLAIMRMDDGTEKRLAISYYGSFFKILDEPGYFSFEGEARDKFDKAFMKEIVQDQFIPKRAKRNEEEGKPQHTPGN